MEAAEPGTEGCRILPAGVGLWEAGLAKGTSSAKSRELVPPVWGERKYFGVPGVCRVYTGMGSTLFQQASGHREFYVMLKLRSHFVFNFED